MKTQELTYEDLLNALLDERHLGNGYAIRNYSSDPRQVIAMDEMVVAIANKEGWTHNELFEFTNSKTGRYVVDCWLGGDKEMAQKFVLGFKEEMATWRDR